MTAQTLTLAPGFRARTATARRFATFALSVRDDYSAPLPDYGDPGHAGRFAKMLDLSETPYVSKRSDSIDVCRKDARRYSAAIVVDLRAPGGPVVLDVVGLAGKILSVGARV